MGIEKIEEEVDRLAGLATSEAVAEELRAKGVRGWRSMTCSCPLAVHLNTVEPDLDVCIIGGSLSVFTVIEPSRRICAYMGDVYMPPVLVEFVRRFDTGEFAYLRAGGEA